MAVSYSHDGGSRWVSVGWSDGRASSGREEKRGMGMGESE